MCLRVVSRGNLVVSMLFLGQTPLNVHSTREARANRVLLWSHGSLRLVRIPSLTSHHLDIFTTWTVLLYIVMILSNVCFGFSDIRLPFSSSPSSVWSL